MDESEKRRERLKAMRMEAAHAGVSTDSDNSGSASHGLTNPFIENNTSSAPPLQYASPRFDYYTDPMSAFSANRRTNVTPQVSQGYYHTPPNVTPPPYRYPAVNSPGQRMSHAPMAPYNQSASPMRAGSPLSTPQANPLNAWGGPGVATNYNYSPNLSRGVGYLSPGFGQGDSPYVGGRGRGQRYNSSPQYNSGHGRGRYSDSGRGRGRYMGNSSSPGSGPSGRRGARSHDTVSAELRPDLYYRKEMVEDPWKYLHPIIWKDPVSRDSEKSWLPKFIQKKARVSSQASAKSISQPSLAEYLAASFNDSTKDGATDDPGL